MPEFTNIQKHIDAAVAFVEDRGSLACDDFNRVTKFADYCMRHELVPTTVIRDAFRQYGGLVGTVKTHANDVLAAIKNIEKFGSVSAYEAHVKKFNDAAVAKKQKQVFSHQSWARKLGTQAPSKPAAKSGKGGPSLDAAVKAGVITKQQAAALRKMGF